MLGALGINAAEWSFPTLIMYLIALAIARFGFSIRFSIGKAVALFFIALFTTTGFDAIFEIQNRGLRLFDAEPVAGIIPNVFSIPFISSAAALILASKFWAPQGDS